MMNNRTTKRVRRAAAVALSAVLGLAGLPQAASAFQFNNGDLVLAIFGNSTELYYDIGNFAPLLTAGAQASFDIAALPGSPFAPGTGVVAGPETQWTIVGRNPVPATPAANGIYTFSASQNPAENISIVPAIAPQNSRIQGWNSGLNTQTGPTPAGPGASVLLPSSNPAAFTNPDNFNLSGTYGGSWNDGGMQGSIGDVLHLIQGRVRNESGVFNTISNVGRATLSASGMLTVCGGADCSVAPIPVPAAVVLFGSGLVGLVGIARRKLAALAA